MQRTHDRTQTHVSKKRRFRRGAMMLGAAGAAMLLAGAAPMNAGDVEFSEVELFIEINATDGDAGLQIFLDGEGWERVNMYHPDGRRLLEIKARGEVRDQSLTEMFFESAEPDFGEQPLEEFLMRFPEGEYTFRGKNAKGQMLFGSAILTHALPDMPDILWPEPESEHDPADIFVAWDAVPDPPGSEIVAYHIVVERDNDDLPGRDFTIDVEADVLSVGVPAEFFEFDQDYKAEVLAIEASGNKTIAEVEFSTIEE